ncbi:VanW family protein [Candidatus Daviesbacteria bacterium]|nr:VanW family protein [Candidatus Daviesbacteria bacterium]
MDKKSKKPQTQKRHSKKFWFSVTLLFILIILISNLFFFLDKIYPEIFIANTNLTALTKTQAQFKIEANLKERLNKDLNFKYQNQAFTLNLSPNDLEPDFSSSLNQAFDFGRTKIYYQEVNLNLNISFKSSVDEKIDQIRKAISQSPVDAQVKLEDGIVNVTPSQNGLDLDSEALKKKIVDYLNTGKLSDNQLPTKLVSPKLSYQTALKIKQVLDQVKLNPISLHYKDKTWYLSFEDLINLIDLNNNQLSLASANILGSDINLISLQIGQTDLSDTTLVLNPQKFDNYIKKIALDINQPVEEPLFNFDGQKVSEFNPGQDGLNLDINQTKNLITSSLALPIQNSIDLPVQVTHPKNQLTNDLGIKELLGEGVSYFNGSIPNRIFNIGLASSKINGVLIAPGEIFSFVNIVGDISGTSGYKQAYVIKEGRTVLDDGGGVCQVSTTLFRAILNSGLPVIERTAHAYRVGYYEQGFPPGLDATIFSPSVDLKFKNDTSHHILIQTSLVGTSLTIDLYGTSDGRVARISKSVITNQTPPPSDLRQDDPTLPKGTVKQVDFSAWGANVVFSRVVTRAGQTIINEKYQSNYRPWQAIFLVGTGG